MFLRLEQIREPVDEAAKWASSMTRSESRGPGDYVPAMERVARKVGVSQSLIWSLHYRKPKDIWTKAYLKLKAAYEQERRRQLGKLVNEMRDAKKSGADPALVREVLALAGLQKEDIEDE